MIAAVREGKLISMEGDYDHIVNRGSLCVKGISMFATHASPNRLTAPRYRAPGSDQWEDISWDDAIARIAQKTRKTRDAIATERADDKEVPVNRTDPRKLLASQWIFRFEQIPANFELESPCKSRCDEIAVRSAVYRLRPDFDQFGTCHKGNGAQAAVG